MEDSQIGSLGYGRRLLPHIIDERAAAHYKRPIASIPLSRKVEDGFKDISYQCFANAIKRCAHWLLETLGEPVTSNEAIAYLAIPDLRYQILSMAAVKVGYVVRSSTFIQTRSIDLTVCRCSFLHRETP